MSNGAERSSGIGIELLPDQPHDEGSHQQKKNKSGLKKKINVAFLLNLFFIKIKWMKESLALL